MEIQEEKKVKKASVKKGHDKISGKKRR